MEASQTDRTAIRSEPFNLKRLALRIGPIAICVLTVPVIFALCNPFVEIGANDDWTYVQMAKVWSETGGFRFNGWTSAMVGPQAAWGMAFIRMFGFSFSVLRASMMPLAAGCSLLMYCIARWLGAPRRSALLAGLALLMSPLFIPVATMFMTDVPALFLFLTAVYCALRAADAPRRDAILWLGAAALAGVTAGTIRQIMWGAPILMIAAFAVLRRKDRVLVATAGGVMAAVIIAVVYCLHWLYTQPLGPQREVLALPHTRYGARVLLGYFVALVLTLACCCLPAMSYLLGVRRVWRNALYASAGAIGLTAFAAFRHPWLISAPWMGNMLTKWGVMNEGETVLGNQPVILPERVRYLIGTLTVLVLAFTIITVVRLRRSWSPGKISSEPSTHGDRFRMFCWIALPFCIAAPAPMVLRATPPFDRYVLPVLSCGLIGILAIADRLPGRRIASVSWVCLLLAGCYGVATTHDAFRLLEARANAANRLTGAGIARECILGGYEYDGWTELTDTGHIVGPALLPPRGGPIEFWFLRSTPHVKPGYYLVTSRQSQLAPAVALEIPYSTWLAPWRRTVLVQVDPRVSCPGTARAQTAP